MYPRRTSSIMSLLLVSLTSKWTSKTIFDRGEGYITFGVGVRLLGALFCSFTTEDATGSSEPSDSSAFELESLLHEMSHSPDAVDVDDPSSSTT